MNCTRKTLVFGNGIGMALDKEYFSLCKAIDTIWNDGDILENEQKQLICACLPRRSFGPPHGEGDLDVLQVALSACDYLSQIDSPDIHWLSSKGKDFPQAVRKLIYHAARYFHLSGKQLPSVFMDELSKFVCKTKSHIATLNYDNLLYQPLIDRQVLKGFEGGLVDGFTKMGFSMDHLERHSGNDFGYYLHLHGSPLYINRDNEIIKTKSYSFDAMDGQRGCHIVLTHFKHKIRVITSSEVLHSYWKKLRCAFKESCEIILIGYSGDDEHLNTMLRQYDLPKRVVEWKNPKNSQDRYNYWTGKIGGNIDIIQMENILDFIDWERQAKSFFSNSTLSDDSCINNHPQRGYLPYNENS